MATVTAAINAQSIGTSTNIGNAKFSYKLTKQAASTVFAIEVTITTGAGGQAAPAGDIMLYYGASATSMTAAAAITNLKTLKCLLCRIPPEPGKTVIYTTELESFKGDYLYLWVDVPTLPVAATLDVDTAELP